MRVKLFFTVLILSGIFFTSCNKNKSSVDEETAETANDVIISEAVCADIFTTLDFATLYYENNPVVKTATDSCPTITFSAPNKIQPVTVTIDFGTSCSDRFGTSRSGKIYITLSGRRSETGSVRTLTFDDFYYGVNKIEGTYTVENAGLNNEGHTVFNVSLTGGKIILPDASFITYDFAREREYISGFDTFYLFDDECEITGSATGKGINGLSYSYNITTPLRWKAACRFLVSGVLVFTVEGYDPFTLDWGVGNCDSNATVSQGDASKVIQLGN